MKNKEDFYWKEMEPVANDDQFFAELCGLIDRHADSKDERLRYLCALEDFKEEWMENFGATGATWMGWNELDVKE